MLFSYTLRADRPYFLFFDIHAAVPASWTAHLKAVVEDPLLEVRSICSECIREKQGRISEDDCSTICPNYDQGLSQVREHYGLDLEELKRMQGYGMH